MFVRSKHQLYSR
jgi:hypothetical protein